jgi:meso-butanediol dehydrogenase/(S,S)-butanediol dehydrogenase/diacetyl reductase
MLDGKVAVVTGAANGNGRAIALRLAREGAAIVVNDIDEAGADAVVAEVAATGRAIAVVGDVAAKATWDAIVARAVADLGGLDILVNNAGLIRPYPFGEVTGADWDLTLAVNARSVLFGTQAAAAVMGEGASIVNISSVAGRGAPTLSPPYAASKAAVISLTISAARALAPRGIRVNAVCPGIIDTAFNWKLDELLGQQGQGLPPGEFLRRRVETVPLGRIGTPDDVAGVVAFLVGPDASYITGQSLNIDGGLVSA